MSTRYALTLSCPNRPGIVAAIADALFRRGFDIQAAHQFDDPASGRFFMRTVFVAAREEADFPALTEELEGLRARFGMKLALRDQSVPRKVMILASKFDHCLVDLLYRHRIGELPMAVTAVVSNHPRESYGGLDLNGTPFHHLPVTRETKMEQEAALWALVQSTGTELVVLARYMQVLSDALSAKLSGRCINIHHSFLPGFKGAKPYHQAYARGVKLIGATAHYVTADLDEGPIIEQDVERVTHEATPEEMIRRGRDIERRVLSRAVAWHLDDRVIMDSKRTIVFAQ
ncbi:formyltetrahydrofolate deformylase [Humitalea rosea]|uniref:Formyltetrahydrofolate deformylase n=1 Tax=Humitalea rosea TaxID=990373 RepID=A0A2W7HU50_9PROT|nr:formyltetrahydrofolate deformylase [Humitalea rosea]PZW37642.1 formyltetrahydrofolate deformylase [Humitalea rosea]